MNSDNEYLFVYGTLRKGVAPLVYGQIEGDIEWIGFSELAGTLYDIGGYPGAVETMEDTLPIKGEMLLLKDPGKVLQILDQYEGVDAENSGQCEFCRRKGLVRSHDGKEWEAWVYWYNYAIAGKPAIEGKDYVAYLAENKRLNNQ